MSTFCKNILLLALLLGTPFWAKAQETSQGSWYSYQGNNALAKKWDWHNEVQHRNYNLFGDLEQLLLRTGLGYNISANNSNVLLGYAFIASEFYDKGSTEKSKLEEHRIFQQFLTRQNFARFQLLHRYRVEERFFEQHARLRFRYLLSLNFPLNNSGMAPSTLYAAGYNEIFVGTSANPFDRDRLYGALGWVLSDNLRVELGYMTQFLTEHSRGQLQFRIFNTLPLYNN